MHATLYHDLTLADYKRAIVTGYTGGTTWIRLDLQILFVGGMAPVDIRRAVESGATVTAGIFPKPGSEHNGK